MALSEASTLYDVLVVGGGPAALAAAVACAEHGLAVCVAAGADTPWPANYGGWSDELGALGLGPFLGPVWTRTEVVLSDAERIDLGRAYARVAKRRLRGHLLDRCAALGVVLTWSFARSVLHHAAGSRVVLDDGSTVAVRLVVDASGHDPVFVRRRGEATTFQAAVGMLGMPVAHDGRTAFHADTMTFMDLRSSHITDELGPAVPTFLYSMPITAQRVFVEETSLVRGPAVPFGVLLQRLRRRLTTLGVALEDVSETEMCLIPMDQPLPDLDQRVVGFGAAASMVHPATGYSLARAFATAPDLAAAISSGLAAGRPPDQVARDGWRAIWTDDDLLRRELHLFGSGILAQLGAEELRAFQAGFFAMPREHWAGYLDARGDVGGVVRAMASMLLHSSFGIQWRLIRSGTRLPGVLRRAIG